MSGRIETETAYGLSRREFVQRFAALGGCYVISATLPGCSSSNVPTQDGQSPRFRLPQGIGSADPQPDAVLLWARVVDGDTGDPVRVTVQVSATEDFAAIVAAETVSATAATDHTLRCFVEGLEPGRWYWYRFVTPDGFTNRLGRTRTAPEAADDVPLNLAVFSCQNYERGFFNAYRRLLVDDRDAAPEDRIDLCLHVGDFIYENVNGGAMPEPDSGRTLRNRDGSERTARNLPSGGEPRGRGDELLPVSLDDYRAVYRAYLSDPALQEARARYPFACIWDDHEVLNDYWQAYHPGGSLQRRKVAGNQAWFEYVPAVLTRAQAGPAGENPARDFEFVEVEDAPQGDFDSDYLSLEANTRAATGSLTIYRTLRWGTRAEIVLTDGRSYRGPRGLDNTILGTDLIAYPRSPIDPELIRIMNAGRTANGNRPPEYFEFEGQTMRNPRRDSPRGAMLGAAQKQWLKQTLSASGARWKLLCTNVPMMRFGFDTRFRRHGTASSIYWTDSWDGYPVERAELMDYVASQGLTNIVSITGDRHAHFAGFVCADYERSPADPVIPELVGAGISSDDRFHIQNRLFANDDELLELTGFDGSAVGYYTSRAPAMNAWFLFGHECARVLSRTADADRALALADRNVNSHLRYADIDAYGYYTVRVHDDRMDCEFVTIPMPIADETSGEPSVRRRVRMRIPAWTRGERPRFTEIEVEGEAPILGVKSRD